MRQSDGHIHKKKNIKVRSEWTDVCLWSAFSRWTFDRSLKTFIFTQHSLQMSLILNCTTHFRYLFILSMLELSVLVFFCGTSLCDYPGEGPLHIFTSIKDRHF